MYTVLIFDDRTAESFKSFRPLFVDKMRKGELDICVWKKDLTALESNEDPSSGNTRLSPESNQNGQVPALPRIETVLPNIYEMVGDKKEWRAIVVQSYIGEDDGDLKVDSKNPFDYVVNREKYIAEIERSREARANYEDKINALDPNSEGYAEAVKQAKIEAEANFNMHEESDVPLVVLTQMLGGIPKQSPLFIEGEHTLDEKTQKLISNVITVPDAEAECLYRNLERRYRFQANRPKELLLVSVRPQQEESLADVKASWTDYDELESSQFWSYNHYATCCRFLTYSIEQKGSVQAQGDLLKLWLTVGLLASNPLDPSTFQAYHLYALDLHVDRAILADTFNNVAVTLASASRYLNRSIDQDHKRFLNEKIDPPEYDVNINIAVEDHKIGEIHVSDECYGLAAKDGEEDVAGWQFERENVDKSLTKLRRMTSRAVEGAAERMRGNCEYDPEQVEPLSNYQSKEFGEQLKDTYQEILDDQVLLPFDELSTLYREKSEQQKTIVTILKERMTAKKLIVGYIITSAIVLLALLPSLIHSKNTQTSVLIPILGSLAISALVFFVLMIVMASIQRKELLDEISSYNGLLSRIREKIDSNAEAYSMFLSGVGSHMKGSSYLNILQQKVFKREDLTQQKRHHLDAINGFRLIVEDWARALYIDCDFSQIDHNDNLEFDGYDMPNFESLYMLEYGKSVKIPINKSGVLTSSYSFITGLDVVREELYDDVIFSRDLDSRDSE